MFHVSTIDAIKAAALAAYPEEMCGLVVNGGFVLCENRAADPREAFSIDPALFVEYGAALDAVVHSHPDAPCCPSAADMAQQVVCAVPFGVVSTDGCSTTDLLWWGGGVPLAPLLGRGFVHGVTDCYGAIADWYSLERGVALPVFPRDWAWWRSGGDLYRDGFERAGFQLISFSEAAPGDVVLFQLRSDVPNHGAVIDEGGLMYHHPALDDPVDPFRLARREPFGRWRKHATHFLRFSP